MHLARNEHFFLNNFFHNFQRVSKIYFSHWYPIYVGANSLILLLAQASSHIYVIPDVNLASAQASSSQAYIALSTFNIKV